MCYCLQRYLKLNVFTNLRTLFRIFQYNFSSKKSVCNKIVRFFPYCVIFHPFLFVAKIFATKKIAIWETLSNSELSLMASILLTERKHIVINMQSVTSIQNFASFCRQNHSHQYHFQCPQEIDEARLRHQNKSKRNRRPLLQAMGSRKRVRFFMKKGFPQLETV